MPLDWSKELALVVEQGRNAADRHGQEFTSAHLLLALFMVKNRAREFLTGQEVTHATLLAELRKTPKEEGTLLRGIFRRAEDVARSSHAEVVTSLHTLVALCSAVDSAAYNLMSKLDIKMVDIRNTAVSFLMERPDQSVQTASGSMEPTPPTWNRPSGHKAPPSQPAPSTSSHAKARPSKRRPSRTTTVRSEERPGAADDKESEKRPLTYEERLARKREERRRRKRKAEEARDREKRSRVVEDLAQRALAAKDRDLRRRKGSKPPPLGPLPPTVIRRGAQAAATSGSHARAPATAAPRQRREDLTLDPERFPILTSLGRNLSLAAFDGEIDLVVGRDDEIDHAVDILNKRRANNPVFVGEAGVGKTAIVEGLAHLAAGIGDPKRCVGIEGRILVALEASSVIAGTGVRGSFSQRLRALRDEVADADGDVVVFLDELHHWIGLGSGADGNADAAGELKTALARGTFPCIGATTHDEYREFIEKDPAFERRFHAVRVDEPDPEATLEILRGIRSLYEEHHGVAFSDEALDAAVRLGHRYVQRRRFPDKAIEIVDSAGANARRLGVSEVGKPLIAQTVARMAGIAPDKLLMSDRQRFLNLEKQLMEHIVGHGGVIDRIAQTLRRNYAGFVNNRPIGSFLFLGPTGVGKTELARALAAVLFDDPDAMLRLDLSEYMESHAVARLIGAPPGYVGFGRGGMLTEPIRTHPYQIVLLDEVEKAHPDVLNVLLQLLDSGRLTDSRGQTVDFSNTIIVMTSNLGAEAALTTGGVRRVGFGARSDEAADRSSRTKAVIEAARATLRPELWNRIDEPLVFHALDTDQVAHIARLQLADSSQQLFDERGIAFSFAPDVIDLLIDAGGFDPTLGARPMRRTIERLVESPIAELILSGEVVAPGEVEVFVQDGEIAVRSLGLDDDLDAVTPTVPMETYDETSDAPE